MRDERYSIQVDNESSEVLFHGHFSVQEIQAFIELYSKQGFKYVIYGEENSAFRLTKINYAQKEIPEIERPQHSLEADAICELINNLYKFSA